MLLTIIFNVLAIINQYQLSLTIIDHYDSYTMIDCQLLVVNTMITAIITPWLPWLVDWLLLTILVINYLLWLIMINQLSLTSVTIISWFTTANNAFHRA